MKATINGITVEGTPEEIAQYERIKAQEKLVLQPYPQPNTDWMKYKPSITCDRTSTTATTAYADHNKTMYTL